MTDPLPGSGSLPVRRSYPIDRNGVQGVVVEIDATADERALAVQQAGLHPLADGDRLGFGYDLSAYGLGAWVSDRRVQLRVWPVIAHPDGTVEEDHPDHPGSDVLVIHFDPSPGADADALRQLAETGRLFIAGPDAGPVPLVLEVDREWVSEAVAEVGTGSTG
ncbi:MAG: hypothetical protein GX643_08040 [Acidimicrobiales bacterium]|nr:hypothetical protein [Acidimicrobiales bacterium]